MQREREMSSAEGAMEGPQGTQVAQKLECWGVAGRRVVGKGQGTSVDLEEGVGERVEDTMVVEVLGKVPESLTLHSEIEEIGMGNSTEQTKLERIPLMDISMG